MMTNSQIRQQARALLAGRWITPVLISFLLQLLASVFTSTAVFHWFISNPAYYGFNVALLRFVRSNGGDEPRFDSLFEAFNRQSYGRVVFAMLLRMVYVLLWSLLLIVPGIIKALSYSMIEYVIADDSTIDCQQALNRSQIMMDGHKMDYFLLQLGYLALVVVCVTLTLGIGLLWLNPYYATVKAKFYDEVKADYESHLLKA